MIEVNSLALRGGTIMRGLPRSALLHSGLVVIALCAMPLTLPAQGFGGQGGGQGGQGGGQLGSGFSMGGGQLGSGFGQSGGMGQLGSGFSMSGSSGMSGSFLGSSQGFRPSNGTGLTGRLPGNSSSDPFGTFRKDPRAANAATGNTTGMNNNRQGNMTGMGMQGLGGMNRFGNMGGFNQFGMNRGGNMGGMQGMGMNQGMTNQNSIQPGFVLRPNIPTSPPQPRSEMIARLESTLRGATTLRSLDNLSVRMEGDTVILGGTVATDTERTLSEAILRLEPGVYSIKNEIQVKPPGS